MKITKISGKVVSVKNGVLDEKKLADVYYSGDVMSRNKAMKYIAGSQSLMHNKGLVIEQETVFIDNLDLAGLFNEAIRNNQLINESK